MRKRPGIRFFLILFLHLALYSLPVMGKTRTVRVGCVDIENFLSIDGDGIVSGYCVEYLKKISSYTGWEYEYVQGSWEDCLSWLKEGKIDLLCPAEYSKERAADYLYSQKECCLDYAALIGRKSDDSCYFEDFEAFDGMTIGMIRGNYLNEVFEQYAENHGFTYHAVYYANGTQLAASLKNMETDAIVNGNMEYDDSQKLLAKIRHMPAYFITSADHSALMDELNRALEQIFLADPYYTATLHSKYYEAIERQSIGLTRQEAQYVSSMGEINVLFKEDNEPMEWFDTADCAWKGVYPDLLSLIEAESGLNFRCTAVESNQKALETVQDGRADILIGYDPVTSVTPYQLIYTQPFYDCSYSLIGRLDCNLDLTRPLTAAIPTSQIGLKDYIARKRPDWNIVAYEHSRSCLKAVSEGRADLALINTLRLSVDKTVLDQSLVVIDSSSLQLPISLGLSGHSDPLLLSILNKAILKVEPDLIEQCVFNSTLSYRPKPSLPYLIRTYPFTALLLFAGLMLTVFVISLALYENRRQKKQNLLLSEKNMELKEAILLQEHLRHQAELDLLTGLMNKNTAESKCQTFMNEHPESVSTLIIMDLDGFKEVNDVYGHLAGDAMLKKFGEILLGISRSQEIAGRIGGDEFLLFLPDMDGQQQVERRVNAIYAALRDCDAGEDSRPLSCSMGVVTGKADIPFYELFSRADCALYEAKHTGGNRYVMAE